MEHAIQTAEFITDICMPHPIDIGEALVIALGVCVSSRFSFSYITPLALILILVTSFTSRIALSESTALFVSFLHRQSIFLVAMNRIHFRMALSVN